MIYDITNRTAPKMPSLGKGTECIKLILSQVSPDMQEAIVPMLFPSLGAFVSGAEFMYPDQTWKELCGMLAHLIGSSGVGKGQLSLCVEAIMRKFRARDEGGMEKIGRDRHGEARAIKMDGHQAIQRSISAAKNQKRPPNEIDL